MTAGLNLRTLIQKDSDTHIKTHKNRTGTLGTSVF